MKSRLTQLLARFVAMALTAIAGVFGVDVAQGDTDSLAVALSAAVVAIVLYFADLLMHKAETGGITKPAGTRKLGLLVPLALVLTLGGCASMSDSQKYAFTSNGFSATVDQVAFLIELGEIDDDQLDTIQAIAHEIDDELDALDAALRNDIPLDYRFALARVERLLGRLVQYQLDAEGVSYGPSSMDRYWYADVQGRRTDQAVGRASSGRRAGLDLRGTGPGQGPAEDVDGESGRRDRLAQELRRLDRRRVELASVAASR